MRGRAAAAAALLAAVAAAGLLLLRSGEDYRVTAVFLDAAQITGGNVVQVGGRRAGVVEDVRLGRGGAAEVVLRVDDRWAPLREGTRAVIRSPSLSSPSGRVVDLQLGPGDAPALPDGAVLSRQDTTTLVSMDQLIATFDPATRRAARRFIQGSARQWRGREAQANAGLRYLNPALVGSTSMFAELTANRGHLVRFLTATGELQHGLAARRRELERLVPDLADTLGALADRRDDLAATFRALPPFLRRANTSLVNVRATLGDLDPLVEDLRPLSRRLGPFLRELRPLARQAVPTVRDLAAVTRRRGADNDLTELNRLMAALREPAVGPVEANGRRRQGAYPAMTRALEGALEEVAFARPYAGDFAGLLDEFGHSGFTDAYGSVARTGTHVGAYTLKGPTLVPLEPRDALAVLRRYVSSGDRCPGSAERDPGDGSIPYRPTPDFPCDPRQAPLGP